MPLHQALRAHTIDAARTLHRDKLVGFDHRGQTGRLHRVAADPYAVDPAGLADAAAVQGTWLGGERTDLDAFLGAVRGTDATPHAHLATRPAKSGCC